MTAEACNLTAPNVAADNSKQLRELREATQKFEAIFVSMLLKAMRKSVPRSGFLSGGFHEEVFQTMLDNSIAESMSTRGSELGIAQMLYNNLAPMVAGRRINASA
jgi:flagellar protein FlgJ